MRNVIQGFMSTGEKLKVQSALDDLIEMCGEAKCIHDSLLVLLPCDEREQHEIWFEATMLSDDECIANVKMRVSSNEGNAHGNNDVVDDVNPEGSVSNVGSKRSSQPSGRLLVVN